MLKVLLTVAAIALEVWATVRLLDQRRLRGGGRPTPPKTPPRVTGPDDDPEFLRDLERRRRREEKRRKQPDQSDEPD